MQKPTFAIVRNETLRALQHAVAKQDWEEVRYYTDTLLFSLPTTTKRVAQNGIRLNNIVEALTPERDRSSVGFVLWVNHVLNLMERLLTDQPERNFWTYRPKHAKRLTKTVDTPRELGIITS